MSSPQKTVLITGCSSGFGRGMVDEFLARGWHVFATMRRAEERRELLSEPLEKYPDQLTLLSLDVTDAAERGAAVEAVAAHGRLDCLVNNAGYGTFGALENVSEHQLRDQMEANFFGPVLLTRLFLPRLRASRGKLIFVTSIFGINGFPLTGTYCSSKFALEGMAESLHYELAPHGVSVALIEPGGSVTGFGVRVIWGEGEVETYQEQTAAYHRLKKKINERGVDITPEVARRTADVAEGKSRRLRRRVGGDAHAGYLFRRLTPSWLSVPLSRLLYGRIFKGAPE